LCVPSVCDLIAFGVWWFVLEEECVLRAGLRLKDLRSRDSGEAGFRSECGFGDGARLFDFIVSCFSFPLWFHSESFEVEFIFELELDRTAACDCDSSIVSNPQKVYMPVFAFAIVLAFREFNPIPQSRVEWDIQLSTMPVYI
jgi:hypothetical protein